MFDLAILHLSDLHIGGEGKSISKPLNSLLADIKTQVQSIPDKKLVIAVTGDTINIGDYRALESAKTFGSNAIFPNVLLHRRFFA